MTSVAYPNQRAGTDWEAVVMDLLRERFPVTLGTPAGGRLRVATDVPDDLASLLGSAMDHFVRVGELTSATGGRLRDDATVDVDVFARTRAQSRDLAVAIQTLFEGYPLGVGQGSTYRRIDSVVVSMKPQRVPWPDETLRRYYSSYRLSARR